MASTAAHPVDHVLPRVPFRHVPGRWEEKRCIYQTILPSFKEPSFSRDFPGSVTNCSAPSPRIASPPFCSGNSGSANRETGPPWKSPSSTAFHSHQRSGNGTGSLRGRGFWRNPRVGILDKPMCYVLVTLVDMRKKYNLLDRSTPGKGFPGNEHLRTRHPANMCYGN